MKQKICVLSKFIILIKDDSLKKPLRAMSIFLSHRMQDINATIPPHPSFIQGRIKKANPAATAAAATPAPTTFLEEELSAAVAIANF